MANIGKGRAKSFYVDDNHAFYRKAPFGNQLVVPKSPQANILAGQHQATVAAHQGMNKIYYAMRR